MPALDTTPSRVVPLARSLAVALATACASGLVARLPAQQLSFRTPAAELVPAGEAALARGDSVRASRAFVWAAIQNRDPQLAVRGLQLVGPSGDAAALRLALLAFEYGARQRAMEANADTALVLLCRVSCADLTDRPEELADLLRAELKRDPSRKGYVVRFIVSAIARIGLQGREPELQAMGWYASGGIEELAVEDAQRRGDRAAEIVLRTSRAYSSLPSRPVPVVDDLPIVEAQAALALVGPDDRATRARLHGILALAHRYAGRPDSARAHIARARAEAAALSPDERTLLHRRAAVVEAAAGDTTAALRLLADAIAARGADQALNVAYDRLRVATALVESGNATAALRLARLASPALAAGAPVHAAAGASLLGEAHHAAGAFDSAATWFGTAADRYASIGADAKSAEALAAAAEAQFEGGRIEEALATLQRAGERAAAWPWDAIPVLHRVLNDAAMVAMAAGEEAQADQLIAQLPPQLPGSAEAAESESIRLLRRVMAAPADSVLAGTRRPARDGQYITVVQDPPRAALRPHTDALWASAEAERGLMSGDIGRAYRSAHEALGLSAAVAFAPTAARVNATLAVLFAIAGREDSASAYRARAEGAPPRRALEGLVLTPDSLQPLRRLAPAAERARLEALLAAARARRNVLGEAWVLAALAEHHARRAQPRRADRATAYYDTAATAFQAIGQGELPDWYRIQFAERVYAVQADAVLAWLARADEIGAQRAAYGALAAADRLRGEAFNLLTGAGHRGTGLASRVFRAVQAGEDLTELGQNLLTPPFTYGSGPRMLVLHHAGDTLVRFLRIPHTAGEAVGTREIRVTRVAIGRDSLATLVTRARAAIGADAAATRSVAALEPASAGRVRGIVAARPLGDANAELRALAGVLLPPDLLAGLPTGDELLVVASGNLASVPLTALPTDTAGTPLSARAALRYVPSLAWRANPNSAATEIPRAIRRSVLDGTPSESESVRRERRQWLGRAVVVGNPTMPQVGIGGGPAMPLEPLPGAEREAVAVAERLAVRPVIGDAATFTALRMRARDATVLHLATHGYAYGTEQLVGQSFVALAPAAAHEGLLTVNQMLAGDGFDLQQTNLVVLSACQTGLGQVTASEGTLGLQRAFLAAGAASVLVSLWSVSDDATALLLERFYHHWLSDTDDVSKPEALRRAQEDLRRDPRFTQPRHWAAFQLVGLEAGDVRNRP